jgi:hypothetical protein
MFKAKAARVAAFVLIVAGAAVFISCQDGTTAPAPPPESEAPSFDVVRIWGYVTNQYNEPLKDAQVVWWCNTCSGEIIGDDAVDDIGRYDIDPPEPFNWDDHDGHDLEGEASKTGYTPASQYIYDFDSSAVYQRDFVLYSE